MSNGFKTFSIDQLEDGRRSNEFNIISHYIPDNLIKLNIHSIYTTNLIFDKANH